MKKGIIVTTLLISSILCSCANQNSFVSKNAASISSTSKNTVLEGSTSENSPPSADISHLYSYDELASFVIPEELRVRTSRPYIPDCYKNALGQMITDGIPIPCKSEKPIQLQSFHPGESCIVVFAREAYYASAIQYDAASEIEPFWIRISLKQDFPQTFSDADSGSEILRTLAPTASNLHNAQERKDDYPYIGERTITTATGSRNALYLFDKYGREHFLFMQNGYVLECCAKPDVLTDEWFEDFSIELMPVSNTTTTE